MSLHLLVDINVRGTTAGISDPAVSRANTAANGPKELLELLELLRNDWNYKNWTGARSLGEGQSSAVL